MIAKQNRRQLRPWKISDDGNNFCRVAVGTRVDACGLLYFRLGDEYRIFSSAGQHLETFTVSEGDTEGLK